MRNTKHTSPKTNKTLTNTNTKDSRARKGSRARIPGQDGKRLTFSACTGASYRPTHPVRLAHSAHPIHPLYLLPTGPNLTNDDHTLNPTPSNTELRIAEQYDERDDVPMGLYV
jgi:hypothetical protein